MDRLKLAHKSDAPYLGGSSATSVGGCDSNWDAKVESMGHADAGAHFIGKKRTH